jgi:peptidoglycan/LPS O-acetylase OafA/YrhL
MSGIKREHKFYVVAIGAGLLVWISMSLLYGKSEGWDTPEYFGIGIPFLCIVAGALAIKEPKRAWRWAFLPLLAQAVFMTLQQGFGNMMPFGILVFLVLSLPLLVSAYIGVFIRKKLDEETSP